MNKKQLCIAITAWLYCSSLLGFCVQTLNVYSPLYASQKAERLRAISAEIDQQKDCEINGFQEVWSQEYAEILASQLSDAKGYFYLDRLRDNESNISGLAFYLQGRAQLVSLQNVDYKINYSGFLDWFRMQLGVVKSFAVLQVLVDGDIFQVLNTHLHPTSTAVRSAQIFQMAQFLRNSPNRSKPWLIMGDFNADVDSTERKLLEVLLGAQLLQVDGCTYCKENPLGWGSEDRIIDHLFLRQGKELQLEVLSVGRTFRPKGDFYFSDHYGIRADFSVGAPEPLGDLTRTELPSWVYELWNTLPENYRIALGFSFDELTPKGYKAR